MLNLKSSPFTQTIHLPGVDYQINILREDLVHPFTGGNKWRKLKYNLIDFREQNKKTLLTFGGAFSNHLIATAAATNQLGIDCIGIVRGDQVSNPCIRFMVENKMKLVFISREDYRQKDSPEFCAKLLQMLEEKGMIKDANDIFILPEGGSNLSAVEGTMEIASELIATEHIFCACGTGATIAGISKGIRDDQHVHGIPVLKAESFMEKNISELGGDISKITLHYDYHFGGYARTNAELDVFCRDFYLLNQIQIEPVYTGKMLFALQSLLKKGTFQPQSSITAIHTGGVYPFYPIL